MNLWYFVVVLLQLVHQLCHIQLAVRPSSLDDLALLLKSEILPFKGRPDMCLEQSEDLVVRNGPRVSEVVDSGLTVFCKEDACRKQVGQNCIRLLPH